MMTKKSQPLNMKDLKNSLLLRGIDLDPVLDLLKDCPVRELEEGTVLMHAGKPNRLLYLVLSGRLRIHIENLDLDPIAILEPGEIAGELSLIDNQVTSASVVADGDCRLLELDEKTMWTLVEDSHAVARNLLFILSRRLRHGNAVIGASLLEKVSELELEEFQPQGIPENKGGLETKGDNDTVSLYNAATAYVSESIEKAQKKKPPDRKKGEKLVQDMIDSISESSALLLLATERTQEFAVSTHSVNVTILALRLAQTLDKDPQNQIKVGFAALLHELGVALLPERLLYQPGQVSPQVRQRPTCGAKLFKKFYPKEDWLSETVGQVYERANGSGFPLGLEGEQLREEAQILGIVDVFEACIHDRPYRRALTGYQLLEELTRGNTKTFSDHIVKALVRSFSLYPYNEYVLLNTDELGQVVEINPQKLSRPVIQILYDKQGKLLSEPRETDLSQHPSLFISKAVTYYDLP